jgi:thioredoxin reductase
MARERADLVIVGGGPAGLSAAREAAKGGLHVMVLEREAEAGGAPRYCGHRGFGMLDYGRLWTGPQYADHLRRSVQGVDLRCGHAVTALASCGVVDVSGNNGPYVIEARSVLIATGVYEKPYAARLISGARPFGILTTGALQRFVYLQKQLPCRAPLVVGSELIAYSTILTLRHFGVKPVAFVESANRSSAALAGAAARFIFGVPTFTATRILAVEGNTRVSGVRIENAAGVRTLACDGVIFSGDWVPESTLLRSSHIGIDPVTKGPTVDTHYRTKDSQVFAAGNVLRPGRSSGSCALEGRNAARSILADFQHRVPSMGRNDPGRSQRRETSLRREK